MTLLALPAALCAGLLASSTLAAEPTEPITPTERTDLFNGKDLSGWTVYLQSNAPPSGTFTVRDDLMHCSGQPFGYVRTDRRFRDYKLTVEWRFVRIAPRADNTGVFVHLQPPDKIWPACVENQGQSQHQGDFIFMGGATCMGSNGPVEGWIAMQAQPNEHAVGEWNTYEVVCRGDTVESYVNGRLMNEAHGCNFSSGAIALQSEGGEWEVRKIYLEPLEPDNP